VADPECLFCRIVRGEIPASFVHEDELIIAFPDIAPQAPTHLLLIPREHLGDVLDLDDRHGPLLARLMATAARLATDAGLDRSGFRLVTNTGADAGQSVHHLHWHLLGGRPMRWPPG